MRVCSTKVVYHALLNPQMDKIEAILADGLRPLSDFPNSERWQQIEKHMPGFYKNLYDNMIKPVLKREYENSGIFVSPIDFQKLPGSFMNSKTRIAIPVTRLDPDYCVVTWEFEGERVTLPLNAENLEKAAKLWTADLVNEWFAKDNTRIFYYVPQIAVYQPGGIKVVQEDVETFG